MDENQQWNWTRILGEFVLLMMWTVKGPESGICEAGRGDGIRANSGIFLQQARVRCSSLICGGLARQG
jgi:hypothetical protein